MPDDNVPPFLTFADIEMLHYRLIASVKAQGKNGYIEWVCKAYEHVRRRRSKLEQRKRSRGSYPADSDTENFAFGSAGCCAIPAGSQKPRRGARERPCPDSHSLVHSILQRRQSVSWRVGGFKKTVRWSPVPCTQQQMS